MTRFRFVAAPSFAGFTCAMCCAAEITQKSRSPQTTSRISSCSGSRIIVVYRSLVVREISVRSDAETSRTPVVCAPHIPTTLKSKTAQ